MPEMTNMDHMQFLEAVTKADVEHLREKEKTYKGSWKAAGGRSAWFMLRRKIDRLLVMMEEPVWPESFGLQDLIEASRTDWAKGGIPCELSDWFREMVLAGDVFYKIEAEPDGSDGTVLAEIRDLRRYLILVEAEMEARGVILHAPTANEVRSALKKMDQTGEQRGGSPSRFRSKDGTEYTVLGDPILPEPTDQQILDRLTDGQKDTPLGSESFYPRKGGFGPLPGPLTVLGPGTPEDGGHHASRMEDGVSNETVPDYAALYIRDPLSQKWFWNVDRRTYPDQVKYLPELLAELNDYEWKTICMPEYRGMYRWYIDESKWKLDPEYVERWGRTE